MLETVARHTIQKRARKTREQSRKTPTNTLAAYKYIERKRKMTHTHNAHTHTSRAHTSHDGSPLDVSRRLDLERKVRRRFAVDNPRVVLDVVLAPPALIRRLAEVHQRVSLRTHHTPQRYIIR